jgi:hypothetical protein
LASREIGLIAKPLLDRFLQQAETKRCSAAVVADPLDRRRGYCRYLRISICSWGREAREMKFLSSLKLFDAQGGG